MRRAGAIVVIVAVAAAAAALLSACRKHVTQSQCDAIVGHYAELVVKEQFPDASAEVIAKESAREQSEAKNDEGFKNCTTELEPSDYDCATHAATPDALEACLK